MDRYSTCFLFFNNMSPSAISSLSLHDALPISPFNPRPLMKWVAKLHGAMSGFFKMKTEPPYRVFLRFNPMNAGGGAAFIDRKSTRLNSSHVAISYAVVCLKKKNIYS